MKLLSFLITITYLTPASLASSASNASLARLHNAEDGLPEYKIDTAPNDEPPSPSHSDSGHWAKAEQGSDVFQEMQQSELNVENNPPGMDPRTTNKIKEAATVNPDVFMAIGATRYKWVASPSYSSGSDTTADEDTVYDEPESSYWEITPESGFMPKNKIPLYEDQLTAQLRLIGEFKIMKPDHDDPTPTVAIDEWNEMLNDAFRHFPSAEELTSVEYRESELNNLFNMLTIMAQRSHVLTMNDAVEGPKPIKIVYSLGSRLIAVAERLGVAPSVGYTQLVMNNMRFQAFEDATAADNEAERANRAAMMARGKLPTDQNVWKAEMTVTGWGIEERFYEAHAYQEEFWATAVNACIGLASVDGSQADQTRAIKYLNEMGVTLEKSGYFLTSHFKTIHDPVTGTTKLTPEQFFWQLRPYISNKNQAAEQCFHGDTRKPEFTSEESCNAAGFEWSKKADGDFGRGMDFEHIGVEYKRGPTGAQTPTPRYFDHVLGVTMHGGVLKDVLDQFHGFMPPAHEEAMQNVRNIRGYVMEHRNNKELVKAYNNAIAGLAKWRRMHFTLVRQFIIHPLKNRIGLTADETWAVTGNGTGGSDIRSYLTDHIRTTEETADGRCPFGRWWTLAGAECPFGGGGRVECPFGGAARQRIDPTPITPLNSDDETEVTRATQRARPAVHYNRVMVVAGLVVTLAALLPTVAANAGW